MQAKAEDDRFAEEVKAVETGVASVDPPEAATVAALQRGAFVYLGRCGSVGWTNTFFAGLPACDKGLVEMASPVDVVAKTWVRMHVQPPALDLERPPLSPTMGQVALGQRVTLLSVHGMAKRRDRHYWGRVMAEK
jgi:hypothetical protein